MNAGDDTTPLTLDELIANVENALECAAIEVTVWETDMTGARDGESSDSLYRLTRCLRSYGLLDERRDPDGPAGDDTAPLAGDPLADVEPGDAHPGYDHLVIDDGNHDACQNEGPRVEGWGWGGRTCCTRPVGHVGQHVATAPGRAVIATWPAAAGPRAGDTAGSGPAAMLAEFHAALGQRYGDGGESNELRATLLREETREACDELAADHRVGIAQELADLVYVAYGTAYSHGIDLDAVLAEIHRANMSKFDPDGGYTVRADGKLLKGPHFRPADVAAVLDDGSVR